MAEQWSVRLVTARSCSEGSLGQTDVYVQSYTHMHIEPYKSMYDNIVIDILSSLFSPQLLVNINISTKKNFQMQGKFRLHMTLLVLQTLEDTARYAGRLLAPAEGLGRGFFSPSGKKRAYYAVLAHFWCLVVTLVTGCPSVPNLGTDGQVRPSVPILGTDGQISKNLKNSLKKSKS